MMLIVMTEYHRQIHHRYLAVRFWHDADVVSIYCLFRASVVCPDAAESLGKDYGAKGLAIMPTSVEAGEKQAVEAAKNLSVFASRS